MRNFLVVFLYLCSLALAAGAIGFVLSRILRWFHRHTRACPQCGSRSENWKPESDACADCGYGVVFRGRVSDGSGYLMPSGITLIEQFMAGDLTEDEFAGVALAGGMRVATIMVLIDQRRAEFHDKGEEPPL